MASTYTSSNGLEKQGSGENENTWGDKLNDAIAQIDTSLDGVITIDVSAANVTLTTTDGVSNQARYRTLRVEGDIASGSTRTITLPDKHKWYNVEVATSGSGTVTLKNTSDSTGVTISAGSPNQTIICDGTSTRSMILPLNQSTADDLYLEVSANLSDITNASAARVNLGLTSVATLALSDLHDLFYPVGSIYVNYDDSTNPGTLLGFGTWTEVGEGRVLVGEGTGTDVNGSSVSFTATSTGGEYTHTQTTDEVAPHTHQYNKPNNVTSPGYQGGVDIAVVGQSATTSVNQTSASVQGMNVMQPYVVVYMWRRTA